MWRPVLVNVKKGLTIQTWQICSLLSDESFEANFISSIYWQYKMFVVVKLPRKTHSKDVVKLRTGGKDLAVHADSLCGLKKVWRREGEVEWTQGGLVLRNSDSFPLTRIAKFAICKCHSMFSGNNVRSGLLSEMPILCSRTQKEIRAIAARSDCISSSISKLSDRVSPKDVCAAANMFH